MRWRTLGNWLPTIHGFTHAAMPTYHEGTLYFSPRDFSNRSHIYAVEFSPTSQSFGKTRSIIGPGRAGAFDDSGCMVSYVNRDTRGLFINYVGWNVGVTVPFRNAIGLIVNGERYCGPLIDRSLNDPCGVGSSWGDNCDWYLSVLNWHGKTPCYHIVNRSPHSEAITHKDGEFAIARPCVVGNRMYYCYRGDEYRLGYADTVNGLQWERKDDIEIDRSENGFDSQAQAYPCVFKEAGNTYMLYNGNGYGRTGFGLAILD